MNSINILSIGGYDPTGGAGVIADAKTIKILDCNPLTITTTIIPQNNQKVYSKLDLPKEEIENQFKSIFADFEVKTVKTGVINKDTIDLILKYQKKYDFKIICDPVLKSTTDYNFVDEELIKKYFSLFEKSCIITPNKEEYSKLKEFEEYDNLKNKNIYTLITGIEDKLLFNDTELRTYSGKRINKECHGTGCVFSSAIASFIAKDYDIVNAIRRAKIVVLGSVIYANKTKYGYNSNPVYINREKVIKNLNYALYLLNKVNFEDFVPEVGANLAESSLLPKSYNDVAALTGRIIRNKLGGIFVVGDIEFGASEHIAKIILTACSFDPKIRSCLNIRYSEDTINLLEEKSDFSISSFSRGDEPKSVSSMEWGTKFACENYSKRMSFSGAPDIIYDKGGDGKEPMIRVLGNNSIEVVKKVIKIINLNKM